MSLRDRVMDGLDLGLESMVVRDENVFRGRTAEAESLEFWNNHVSESVTTTVYYLGSLEMDIAVVEISSPLLSEAHHLVLTSG